MPDLAIQHVYGATGASVSDVEAPAASASIARTYTPVLGVLSVVGALAVGPVPLWPSMADHATSAVYLAFDAAESNILEELRPEITAIRALLMQLAQERHIPVREITVSKFIDPEETSEEVVISQYVGVPADLALQYWDQVGAAVTDWTRTLPPERAHRITQSVGVSIRWTDA